MFNRNDFKQVLKLLAVEIPASKCSTVMNKLKTSLLNKPKLKNVVQSQKSCGERLLLLNEKIQDPESLAGLNADQIAFVKESNFNIVNFDLEIGYEYLTADQVLKKILPNEIEIISSFEAIGHIAHLNLRDHILPYKDTIAQVILDKNAPHIRTVVNKLHTIETQFRTFPMEVLAGAPDFNVTLKESGAIFKFDYSAVYWNSRLQGEHSRVVSMIEPGQNVADVFAGVGPFSIPLALKKCKVWANDLNPKSYEFLVENARLNKCAQHMEFFNTDGREFIKQMLCQALKNVQINHMIMNLPKTAMEFLDVLTDLDWSGVLQQEQLQLEKCTKIHVYCFEKSENPVQSAIERVNKIIGIDIPNSLFLVHNVRDVAPKTPMLCVSFPAPLFSFSSEKQLNLELRHSCNDDEADSVHHTDKKLKSG